MTQRILACILIVLTLMANPAIAMNDASCSPATQATATSAPTCSLSSQVQSGERTRYAQVNCRRAAVLCAYYCTKYEPYERYCPYHCMVGLSGLLDPLSRDR